MYDTYESGEYYTYCDDARECGDIAQYVAPADLCHQYGRRRNPQIYAIAERTAISP